MDLTWAISYKYEFHASMTDITYSQLVLRNYGELFAVRTGEFSIRITGGSLLALTSSIAHHQPGFELKPSRIVPRSFPIPIAEHRVMNIERLCDAELHINDTSILTFDPNLRPFHSLHLNPRCGCCGGYLAHQPPLRG